MVTLKVTSHRGHHEAVVETEVATAVFNKMTGRQIEPLPENYKDLIPNTFQELVGLWDNKKMGYTAFEAKDGEAELVKELHDGVQELLFIAPITGG